MRASHNREAWLNCMKHGRRSFERGLLQDAIASFERAVELQPERHEGWVNLGSALLQYSQFETAARSLRRAIALQPGAAVAHMMLGDALRLLGKSKASFDSYARSVALQATPEALNKLACAHRARSRMEDAEALYAQAERMDPTFTLARVNRATLQIERRRYEDAREQLAELEKQSLPPPERREVQSALASLGEYTRLKDAIDALSESGNLAALEARLRDMPPEQLQVDSAALRSVEAYANAAQRAPRPDALRAIALPQDWPLVEGLHMIPLVQSVDAYLAARETSACDGRSARDVLESFNMAPAIRAARECREAMADPVMAELHLRHWHALACRNVEGFLPGHFKYTRNWAARNPTLARVNPSLCSGTFRHFIQRIYGGLPPGLVRAAIVFLALYDPHPFADGNARIGMIWLNRELEWAGLMPALFSRELGFKGKLGVALREIRNPDDDLAPLLAVINQAQQHAVDFCLALAARVPGTA